LRFRTIVGSGNEQAVVWKVVPLTDSTPVNDSVLDSYEEIAYGDVFSDGVPEFFRPGTEEEVVEDVMVSLE
jgi:hypothetical protein